jgi:hypothetical protein
VKIYKFALALLFVLLIATSLLAQESTSVDVQTSCAHWAKLHVDKHKQFKGGSNDLYQTGACVGYFEGMMDGMDNTGGWRRSDGTVGTFQIKRASITSSWDVIRAFYEYVDATPLAKGKPAWNVLQQVLITNGLGSFTPEAPPETQVSSLSNECKAGATNILTEFKADADLKTVDTGTLASFVQKLVVCWDTPHLTDADTALIASATAEAQMVLVTRAMNVLDRNSLLPEFRAERSVSSSSNKTVSTIRGGAEQ